MSAQHTPGPEVVRELLAIAEEMRAQAAVRAERDPWPDTLLSAWAGRIERAIINGETMESAMRAAITKVAGRE